MTARTATLGRSVRLFRAFLVEQTDPDRFYSALAADSVRQLGGYAALDGRVVLDVGGGPGYFADAFRAAGAHYVGVDPDTGELSARGEPAAGMVRASGMALPFPTGALDVCYSSNVLEHVPDPDRMLDEMVRVTRPGGRIVMGNWIPGDPTLVAQLLKISGSYSPPPPEGFISPVTWGVEENVIERFGGAGIGADKISFSRETYTFEYPAPPTELLAVFRNYYGPTMNAFAAAEATDNTEQLQKELADLFTSQNTSSVAETTAIPATFLQITANV